MNSINEYQLRLDLQRFLWPVYYIALYYAGPSWGVIIVQLTSLRFAGLQCSILAQYITQSLWEEWPDTIWLSAKCQHRMYNYRISSIRDAAATIFSSLFIFVRLLFGGGYHSRAAFISLECS